MTTTSYNAAALIEDRRAYILADEARMVRRPAGFPRSAWRRDNPLPTMTAPRAVRDTAFKTRPVRHLAFDTSDVRHTRVWSTGPRGNVIEVLDLRAPDADARLARYERVAI